MDRGCDFAPSVVISYKVTTRKVKYNPTATCELTGSESEITPQLKRRKLTTIGKDQMGDSEWDNLKVLSSEFGGHGKLLPTFPSSTFTVLG